MLSDTTHTAPVDRSLALPPAHAISRVHHASPVPAPAQLVGAPMTFKHTIDIYLKDSNSYANTYFARYFEWQGVCRERWFFQCIRPDMLQKEGVLVTKRAHQDYAAETAPFQSVSCQLNTYDVRQCSMYLLFQFMRGDELVSTGYQQIVFMSHDKRIQRFPQDVLDKMRAYELRPGPLVS